MDIIIEFFGGPMDGRVMSSDSPDPLERQKVDLAAGLMSGYLRDAEKRNMPVSPTAWFTVPNDWIKEQAKKDGWSDAEIADVLKREHKYKLSPKVQEGEGIAHISLYFDGTSRRT